MHLDPGLGATRSRRPRQSAHKKRNQAQAIAMKVSRRDDRGAAAVVGPARRAWEVLGGRPARTDQLAHARELAHQISDALGRPHRLVRVLDDNELDELEYRGRCQAHTKKNKRRPGERI